MGKHLLFRYKKFPIGLVVIFFVLCAVILFGGYLFYLNQIDSIREEKEREITSISKLKSEIVANWFEERRADAEVIRRNPFIIYSISNAGSNPSELPKIRKNLKEYFKDVSAYYNFTDISIFDENYNIISYLYGKNISLPIIKTLCDKAIKNKVTEYSRVYLEADSSTAMAFAAPVLDKTNEKVIGVIVFEIDPEKDLFSKIQEWPIDVKTAEILLVRRDDSYAVVVNSPKNVKAEPLSIKIPVIDSTVSSMAVTGYEGIIIAKDYRDTIVFADVRKVPDSPWYLITKIDSSTVFASFKEAFFSISVIVLILLLSAASGIFLLWRSAHAKQYKQLYESEKMNVELLSKFEAVTKNANDIIFILDKDGNVLEANERAVKTYGYAKEELIGANRKSFYPTEIWNGVKKDISYLTERNGHIFETVHKKKDGTQFPVEVSARIIHTDDAEYCVSIVRDVAERKKMLEQILIEKEKAEKSDRLKSEFLAQMSHEIRTPLNVIINSSDYLESELGKKLNQEQYDALVALKAASKRIIHTIEQVLNMSEIQLGTYRPKVSSFDLFDVLKSLIREFKILSDEKNLVFEFVNITPKSIIDSDEYSVTQIFAGLIDNAIKYTKKGKVKVILENGDEYLVVHVEDTGIGISSEFIGQIYDPFAQEDSGYTRSYNGCGLGLSLVKHYCDMNGAEISVESEKGVGTKFTVKFNLS